MGQNDDYSSFSSTARKEDEQSYCSATTFLCFCAVIAAFSLVAVVQHDFEPKIV